MIIYRLPGGQMTADDARALYYQFRVRLVRLLDRRDRIHRTLQLARFDAASELASRSTQDADLQRELDALTAEIAATTKLVNQYADQIGSPRFPAQGP